MKVSTSRTDLNEFLGLSNVNHERMHKLIKNLIPIDWKEIATFNWNFSKIHLENFLQ